MNTLSDIRYDVRAASPSDAPYDLRNEVISLCDIVADLQKQLAALQAPKNPTTSYWHRADDNGNPICGTTKTDSLVGVTTEDCYVTCPACLAAMKPYVDPVAEENRKIAEAMVEIDPETRSLWFHFIHSNPGAGQVTNCVASHKTHLKYIRSEIASALDAAYKRGADAEKARVAR